MNRRFRVYLSGPISKGDLCDNVNRAGEAFRQLADAGLAPFCPQWSVYSAGAHRSAAAIYAWSLDGSACEQCGGRHDVYALARVDGSGMSHDEWLAVDLAWVAAADAVLRLPGESVGADREVAEAERLGIPVFHSIDDMIQLCAPVAVTEGSP